MVKINIKFILWALVAMWMIVIFLFSSQPADVSSNTSGNFIKSIACVAKPSFDKIDEDTQTIIIEQMQHTIRKLAHFTEYLILGVLVFLAFVPYKKSIKLSFILSALICIFYASTDEFHQLFVAGRACMVKDVFIDSFGAIVGIIILSLIVTIIKCKRKVSTNG